MATKEMTTLEYANSIGISKVAVFKRLKKGGIALLPGVKEVKVFPRQTLFVVEKQSIIKRSKNSLKINQ
jgi:hypothetical protein